VAVYVLWGSTYFAMAIAVRTLPPVLMGGSRFAVAGGILYAILRLRGVPAPTLSNWRAGLVTGALLFGGGNGFVVIAERTVPSGLTAIVLATTPIWATVLSLVWGERPTGLEWTGVLLGMIAIVWFGTDGSVTRALGVAPILLFAPASWTLGSLASRRLDLARGPMGAATQMLSGAALMLAAGPLLGETLPRAVSGDAWLAWLYLIVFGSLLGFTAYGYLIRHTRPALAMSYAYVNPIIAVFLGSMWGGERFSPRVLLASAVVLIAVCLISLGSRQALLAAKMPGPLLAQRDALGGGTGRRT
jgi:drug/metabolite transporter (DMT)-like permease